MVVVWYPKTGEIKPVSTNYIESALQTIEDLTDQIDKLRYDYNIQLSDLRDSYYSRIQAKLERIMHLYSHVSDEYTK